MHTFRGEKIVSEGKFLKALTWAGIAALVTAGVMWLLQRKDAEEAPSGNDESDIFEAELKG